MQRPDELLIKLRPDIPQASIIAANEHETFQNSIIRPVIKLQHQIITLHIESDKGFNTLRTNPGTKEQFRTKLKDLLNHQIPLRNQLLGVIIGMLTTDELKQYHTHSSENNKRVIAMLVQRICDSY